MRFSEKAIVLKDGRTALLRSPTADDAETLLQFLFCMAAETDFTMRYPEERESMTVEAERAFLERMAASESDCMIGAWIDGEFAGNCHISRGNAIKTRHIATLAIGLKRAYWGIGLGRTLMREMEAIGRTLGVDKLELEYIESNERAARLYTAAGFTEYGRHPDAVRLKDGTRLALIGMQKYGLQEA